MVNDTRQVRIDLDEHRITRRINNTGFASVTITPAAAVALGTGPIPVVEDSFVGPPTTMLTPYSGVPLQYEATDSQVQDLTAQQQTDFITTYSACHDEGHRSYETENTDNSPSLAVGNAFSVYLNGTYIVQSGASNNITELVQQHFAAFAERNYALGIAVVEIPSGFGGRLLETALPGDVAAGSTATLRIEDNGAGWTSPSGTASQRGLTRVNWWPFFPSDHAPWQNGKSKHSLDTDGVTSWVRIDDEIIGFPTLGTNYTLPGGGVRQVTNVIRGMFGTAVAPHSVGAAVRVPAYIGTPDEVAGLSGNPFRQDPGISLRYVLDHWRSSPPPKRELWMAKDVIFGGYSGPPDSQSQLIGVLNGLESDINHALSHDWVTGFSIRLRWKDVDGGGANFAILDRAKEITDAAGKDLSIRIMAGRHSPAAVISGFPSFTLSGEPTPHPYDPSSPYTINTGFITALSTFYNDLADWCRANDVYLLHGSWFAGDWSELYFGPEVRNNNAQWAQAHYALIDEFYNNVDLSGLLVEFPASGAGPLQGDWYGLGDAMTTLLAKRLALRFGSQAGMGFNGWADDGVASPSYDANWIIAMATNDSLGLFTQLQAIQPWPVVDPCLGTQGFIDAFGDSTAAPDGGAENPNVRADYVEVYLETFDAVTGCGPQFEDAAEAWMKRNLATPTGMIPPGRQDGIDVIVRQFERELWAWDPDTIKQVTAVTTGGVFTLGSGHGYSVGERIVFMGVDLPLGLKDHEVHYVVAAGASTVTVSRLAGGDPVSLADTNINNLFVYQPNGTPDTGYRFDRFWADVSSNNPFNQGLGWDGSDLTDDVGALCYDFDLGVPIAGHVEYGLFQGAKPPKYRAALTRRGWDPTGFTFSCNSVSPQTLGSGSGFGTVTSRLNFCNASSFDEHTIEYAFQVRDPLTNYGKFEAEFDFMLQAGRDDTPVTLWAKTSTMRAGPFNSGNLGQYNRFLYGVLLVACRQGQTNLAQLSRWHSTGKIDQLPDDRSGHSPWLYDPGNPTEDYDGIAQVRTSGHARCYTRDFTKGVVYFNAHNSAVNVNLPRALYDSDDIDDAAPVLYSSGATRSVPANSMKLFLDPT